MKPLYNEQEFQSSASRQRLPCECVQCGARFTKPKNDILDFLNGRKKQRTISYCSRECAAVAKCRSVHMTCIQCGKTVTKHPCWLKKNKTKNVFCNKSCSAKWHNTHKTKGTRISKLALWLAQELPKLYPSVEFHFNRTDAINGELDIYIPSLKLAFELNGIFHYEPIFGPEKLAKTQTNDERKFQACIERGIELCILDVSKMVLFKPNTAEQFLTIIRNIINIQLSKNNPQT